MPGERKSVEPMAARFGVMTGQRERRYKGRMNILVNVSSFFRANASRAPPATASNGSLGIQYSPSAMYPRTGPFKSLHTKFQAKAAEAWRAEVDEAALAVAAVTIDEAPQTISATGIGAPVVGSTDSRSSRTSWSMKAR
jgi:hypothetical protein